MPRLSLKQLALRRLDDLIATVTKQIKLQKLLQIEVDPIHFDILHQCQVLRHKTQNSRYFCRSASYKKRIPKFHIYLQAEDSHRDGLSDADFLFHFRVTREKHEQLVNLIKDHPVFQRSSDARGPHAKPASHQLLVLLKYYGSEGNGASSRALSNFFGVGTGTIDEYRNNALVALLSLEEQTYFWPTPNERKAIANRIKQQWHFPNCVGLIDGTLLPLASRPLLHGENYLSRKKFYAIVMLIVCDDQGRVLYYHLGWPGSVHDNHVWRTCKLNTKCDDFFSALEYLLGDSAFTPGKHIVPAFKNPPGQAMPENHSAFNTLLASPRVKSEHCIGVLKGRFPFLRSIRLKLGKWSQLKHIIDYVRGMVILQNLLIEEDIEADWYHPDEEDPDDEVTNEPASLLNRSNPSRRSQLLRYLSELEHININ